MNHLSQLAAELAAAQAEATSLRESLQALRTFVEDKGNRNGRGGYIQVSDVSLRVYEALSYASDAYDNAYYNEVGPRIATGGCPHDSLGRTCSHEPSLRPNAYHCPLCAERLPGEWNDTEARAAERMRLHFRATHRTEVTA